ncbi:MAG: ABC transporter ATP-binding protein [Oscillospiraceae bacterium]|nr:ABC transporter ATP-binding protein [Oscillospiraceae bacterium]
MIEIANMSHSLGSKTVLRDINLTIADNTVLGIVGINGAGKSTLLRLLSGVYLPDKGNIRYDGRSPADAETRKDIFFLPDDPYYTAHMTPNSLFDFYRDFHPAIDRETYDHLLAVYQIDTRGKVRNFSKGMRRQVFIALALAVKPKYLLLDEAFDGLDPLSRKIFKEAIISLVEEGRTTVLIASHSLRELEDFCDKFILIDSNTIKSQGDIAEHVGDLCKFELAFTQSVNEETFASLPVVSLSIKNRFVQIVLRGSSEEMRVHLQSLSPAVIDEMPLDFEETFICDVRKEV